MAWDAAKGRATTPVRAAMDVFQSLNTPYRAHMAARYGAGAWGLLFALDLLGALFLAGEHRRHRSWISDNPDILASLHLTVASVEGLFCVMMMRRQPVWAAAVLVLWTICQATGLTGLDGGHGLGKLVWLVLAMAIISLRGTLAVRRMGEPPQFAG